MKLIIACLLAGASLGNVALGTSSASAADSSSNVKNWCPDGALKTITNLNLDTAGFTDSFPGCNIARGIAINIDNTAGAQHGEEAPATPASDDEEADPAVTAAAVASRLAKASTVEIKNGKVGARTTIAIRNPEDHSAARALVPLRVSIHNNVFDMDGHIYVTGALPAHSEIAITANAFNIVRPLDARFPGGFLNNTAVAIALGEIFFLDQSAVRIVNNDISARDMKGRFEVHGISLRSEMYWYGKNATLDVMHNNINARCKPELFNNTLCAFGFHGTETMYMYAKGSSIRVDHNNFNVTGGLLFRMPNILSHLSSTHISTSYNRGHSYSHTNPSSCLVRRYNPFAEYGILNMGAQSRLSVDYNSFHCEGKSGIFGFPTDFTITDFVQATFRGNEISTVGCSPSIYFMNTFSLGLKSILWITENSHSRADTRTSGLASVYFAGEFSVQHESELTINKNSFGKAKSIKPKTKMVGLAPSAINSWRVEEAASINMCENTYNGELIVEEHDLKPHIALKLQEVVMVDDCRTELRPYSDDYEPGGAEDVPTEGTEFGNDQAMEYTKALITDARPEVDTENNNEDDDASAEVKPEIPVEMAAPSPSLAAESEL